MAATKDTARPHYVVGIGASAGGLDPIEKLFDNLPSDTGMAFVIVQHLSPDFKSLMDELLARHTEMPIHLVEDGMTVEANCVYLIPSKKEMIISGGRLLLSDRSLQKELTLPIDVFFRSLAQDCGARAVAIVLSGGGSDGSRGIRDIREAGGLVIVQDTESAQFDGMPKTAREAGVAQWVLAPRDMPRVLLEHLRDPTPAALGARTPDGLAEVYRMLQEEYGLDFTHYKPTTVTRRIERRIALASTPDMTEYVARLRADRGELDVLYRDLLIGVTSFFRDPQAFRLLEERVLPDLIQRATHDTPLRIWVPGCATGEEAYSLAIVVQDLMTRIGERPVKIFATDVHRGSLEKAARAVYPPEAVSKVTAERLERYFVRVGGDYHIVPDLRQWVVFAPHDVIKDAPFTRVDLVSCRNMLIYLQPSVQLKVLSLFHFALNRGGVLVLGPSESPGGLAKDFMTIDPHWKVYRKHIDARMSVDLGAQRPVYEEARTGPPAARVPSSRPSLTRLLGTYDALLDEVMPPSLLVTEHGELVHAFGGASRFLAPRDGRQGLDLLTMVGGELRVVLAGGVPRALADSTTLTYAGVRIETGAGNETYEVSLRRIPGRDLEGPHVLVSFEADREAEGAPRRREARIDLDEGSRAELATLGAELSHTKESLQAAIEELQSTNEELQASNEELQASNEELQSTNEELQSVNEELYTVNAEYQRKIAELTELTNDMDNLLSSTEIGTIFLDRNLTIRKFTPQIAETFSLVAHDVGRSIETFAHRLDRPELIDDLRGVLASGKLFETELRNLGGKSFFMRVLPYRARGKADGVVLTLIDVSGLKAAEDALFHERHLLNSLLSGTSDAIYFKDAHGKLIRTNRAMATRLGLDDPRGAVGLALSDAPNRAFSASMIDADKGVLDTGLARHYQLERRARADAAVDWDQTTRLPLRDRGGDVVGVIVIARDVTAQKRAEEKAQEAVQRRDQFLAMLSHELRNPLSAIVSAAALLDHADARTSAAGQHALDVVGRQSQQMARLLDDLLEVSRVTQNKIELRRRKVDLVSVARETADSFRARLEATALSFTMTGAPHCHVLADPTRLQQIVTNLLGNAIKYTPRGGAITLTILSGAEEGVLSVRDTGAGIPANLLDSVFELFVQASGTLDRSAGGIGVGLTLVRSLVTMHGGTVSASSEGEGTGAEFVVRLPLAHDEDAAPGGGEGGGPRVERARLAAGARIVVIEDNDDSREMLCEVLRLGGYECHTAATGAAGIARVDEMTPSVAIVDIGLPGIDGFEVARRLRTNPAHKGLWLIALTGYGQTADRVATREAGFDEHFVKPIRADHMLRRLGELRDAPKGAADPSA